MSKRARVLRADLTDAEMQALKILAVQRGLPVSELVTEWVVDSLRISGALPKEAKAS